MKKRLFFLLTLLPTLLHAQDYEYTEPQRPAKIDFRKIQFGIYAAPNISWMHPTASKSDDGNYYVQNKGARAGYMWGLMMDYFFAPNYGFTTGFDLNTTGGRIATQYNPTYVNNAAANTVLFTDFDYRLQYLEVPFNLKLRSDRLNKEGLRLFGQLGLALTINISKKADYNVNYNDEVGINRTVQGENEKLTGTLSATPAMLQMNIGGGLEYPITPKLHLYTGIFFNNSFLPNTVSPQNYDLGYKGSFTDGYVRLNNLALRIGIFF